MNITTEVTLNMVDYFRIIVSQSNLYSERERRVRFPSLYACDK